MNSILKLQKVKYIYLYNIYFKEIHERWFLYTKCLLFYLYYQLNRDLEFNNLVDKDRINERSEL